VSVRVAVLASGGGTNLQAILDHFASLHGRAPGQVTLVVSDRKDAGALERARRAGIGAVHLPANRSSELGALLREHQIGVVALAGYLRMIPPDVTRAFHGRIVNVHPALLPAFGGPGMYGRKVHEAVLAAGAKESGATVHFVDDQYDQGAIIAQAKVPVLAGDTPAALAARVLDQEHALYPRVVAALCAGTVTLHQNGTVSGWS
jgi:formyltetrahydrofolate-dependent phosphoribosylglycinamide formyltransferase